MIFLRSLSDDATLTYSSQVETLPAAAVQRTQPRDLWRSTDNANQFLIFDFGVSTFFDSAAVLYHNATGTGNELWRVRTSLTDPNVTTSLVYDSSTMQMIDSTRPYERFTRMHSVHEWSASLNDARYCRIDFTSLSNLTQFDVGRVMIGAGVLDSPSYGFQITSAPASIPVPTRSGLWRRADRKFRTMSFNYPALTDEQAWVYHGELENASSTPLCASITEQHTNTRTTDWTIYGYLAETTTQYLFPNINVKNYVIEEMERP